MQDADMFASGKCANGWCHIIGTWNSTTRRIYQNASIQAHGDDKDCTTIPSNSEFVLGGLDYQGMESYTYFNGAIDEFTVMNEFCTQQMATDLFNDFDNWAGSVPAAPSITKVNFTTETGSQDCTSSICGPTDDTTPNFRIEIDQNAWCRISDTNESYATMGSPKDCIDMGSQNLGCIVKEVDALILGGIDQVYVACNNSNGETSVNITINLSGGYLPINATAAMLAGVNDALTSPTTYTSQQVYIRYADGTQNLTTMDVVASEGNQRWFLNYILDTDLFTNLIQIVPSLYVWENTTLTYDVIRSQVSNYITATET